MTDPATEAPKGINNATVGEPLPIPTIQPIAELTIAPLKQPATEPITEPILNKTIQNSKFKIQNYLKTLVVGYKPTSKEDALRDAIRHKKCGVLVPSPRLEP